MPYRDEEYLTLVDTRDEPIGPCTKEQAHAKPRLHRAFSLFLYHEGEMLLQRRAPGKYHSAGLWSNACCSHPLWGETPAAAVARRAAEELNWHGEAEEQFSFTYCVRLENGLWEYEYDHVFTGHCDLDLRPDPAETDAVRWTDFDDLRDELVEHPERFTAWFLIAAPRVLDLIR